MGGVVGGGKAAKGCLLCFNLIFWGCGLGLLLLSLWMLVDPQRSYLLDLVNYSEGVPLLRIAAYIFLGSGIVAVVIGFLGCCGAIKEIQSMLALYAILLLCLLLASLTAAILAVVFKSQYLGEFLKHRIGNMTMEQYGRLQWVTTFIDTVQYYNECCGSRGPSDFHLSYWQVTESRGALQTVPVSCCRLTESSRPWTELKANYPRCTRLSIDSQGYASSAWTQGCYPKLEGLFNFYSLVFIGLGIGFAVIQLVGVVVAVSLCRVVGRRF